MILPYLNNISLQKGAGHKTSYGNLRINNNKEFQFWLTCKTIFICIWPSIQTNFLIILITSVMSRSIICRYTTFTIWKILFIWFETVYSNKKINMIFVNVIFCCCFIHDFVRWSTQSRWILVSVYVRSFVCILSISISWYWYCLLLGQ